MVTRRKAPRPRFGDHRDALREQGKNPLAFYALAILAGIAAYFIIEVLYMPFEVLGAMLR